MRIPDRRRTILQIINSPLGFYILALLIGESFLGLVMGLGGAKNFLATGAFLGVGMFVLVVACVRVVAWFKPEH